VQFQKWKQQQAHSAAAGSPTNASLMEVFRKARVAVENWVDDERNRPLVLRGALEEIHQDPGLRGILQPFAGYGPLLREKLLMHLAFMVENRRKYYAARAA
jgi:hypothetical protein